MNIFSNLFTVLSNQRFLKLFRLLSLSQLILKLQAAACQCTSYMELCINQQHKQLQNQLKLGSNQPHKQFHRQL